MKVMASITIDLKKELFDGQGSLFNKFANSLNSKPTLREYTYHLLKYCKYHKIISLGDLFGPNIKDQIIEYRIYLKNVKQVSYNYSNLSLCALKHSCVMNDVEASWEIVRKYLGEYKKENTNDRPYSHEEIKRLLDVSSIKMKAIILTLASTGM